MWLAVVEAILFAAVFVADDYGLVPLTKTPFLFLIAWLSLRLRRLQWRDVGLARPANWSRAITIGVAAGIAMELLALFVTEPCIARLAGGDPGLEEFRPVVGNLPLAFILIAASWVLAAFGEELVYRGYVIHRVATAAGGTTGAFAAALVIATLVFGYAHAPGQGLAGALQEGFSGLLLGLLYLADHRNLTVPIVAHGIANTLAFVLIYLGRPLSRRVVLLGTGQGGPELLRVNGWSCNMTTWPVTTSRRRRPDSPN